MGTRPFRELLPLYSREAISAEQAVGYILQNLVQMEKSKDEEQAQLRAEVEALKKEVERLKAFVGMEDTDKG